MAIVRRKRLPDGSFGEIEKIGGGLTTDEMVAALGIQLAQEKLNNIQKDAIINTLGAEVASLKLQILQMKGSESR